MGKVITVANQKGGVGKTITVTCMASILHEKNYKILTISLDPQRNFDMVAGKNVLIKRTDLESLSMLHVIRGACTIEDAIVHTQLGDLVRASSQLYNWMGEQIIAKDEYEPIRDDLGKLQELLDKRVLNADSNAKVLSSRLKSVRDQYDYILIDTNPSLTLLTVNSLYASDYVIIPALSEETSKEAVIELWDTIQGINEFNYWSPTKVLGILMTRCDKRTVAYNDYIKIYTKLADKLGTRLFQTKITRSARASDYIDFEVDLMRHDPKGVTTQDYRNFVEEFEHIMAEEAKV